MNKYYIQHKEEIKEKRRQWRKENPERVRLYWDNWEKKNNWDAKKYRKEYRIKNRDKIKQKDKEYYLVNKEKFIQRSIAKNRTMTKEERNRINLRRRERHRLNPDKRNIFSRLRDAKIRGGGKNITKKQWLELLKKYKNRCAYCGDTINKLTIDHDIPISRGGKNEIKNIVPACYKCNIRKRQLTGNEFLQFLYLSWTTN